ncbi:hypothetical protein B9Y00_13190 [Acinetobacter baumannii]|nr:hypothetical protein B9Y00_13190 [Acinetobacter baumannii]
MIQFNFRLRKAKQVMSIYEFIISVFLIIEQFYSAIVIQPEPYRVCRRVNILRDYPDDKIKIYP